VDTFDLAIVGAGSAGRRIRPWTLTLSDAADTMRA
jgi:hypothetical protein